MDIYEFDYKRDVKVPLGSILKEANDHKWVFSIEEADDLLNRIARLRGYPDAPRPDLVRNVIDEIRSRLRFEEADFVYSMEDVIDPQKRTDLDIPKHNYRLIEKMLFQPFSQVPHLVLRLLEVSSKGRFKAKLGVGELRFIKVK